MFRCSGGRSSPRLSRSLFVAHSSPVDGLKASPTELRRPVAKRCSPDPSALNRVTAARRGLDSSHTLHDDPAATYMEPSGPKTTVRVLCPPLGRPSTIVCPVVLPGANR